jgi:hypothetical protein
MTTNTLTPARAGRPPLAPLAWATIAGAILTFVLGIALAPFQAQEPPPWWIPSLNAVSHLLLLAGFVELARSGAAGRGRLATSGLGLTILGLAVLTVAELVWLAGGAADALYGVATLAFTPGLILLGVAVLRAGRWTGWHRFTPLACGLFVPLVMFPAFALPGTAANYAIGFWGVCWLLLGVAQLAEGAGRPFADRRG